MNSLNLVEDIENILDGPYKLIDISVLFIISTKLLISVILLNAILSLVILKRSISSKLKIGPKSIFLSKRLL